MPQPVSPPGISLLSLSNNQLPTSLQKSYDDWVQLFVQQCRKMDKGSVYPMGEHQHLSPPPPLGASLPFPCWANMGQWLQSLGGHSEPSLWHGLLTSPHGQHQTGATVWGVPSLGEPTPGQNSHHGGGSQEINCLHLQWQQQALHLSAVVWGLWSYTSPQGQTPGHPVWRRGGGDFQWADQPTPCPPTPLCQPPSDLSLWFEQMRWIHYNHSARTTKQQ